MPSRTCTTPTQTYHLPISAWRNTVSRPRDALGNISTSVAPSSATVETSIVANQAPQPSQTSWDIKDPESDAASKKLFGISHTNTIPVEQESSFDWCMKRKKEILALQSSKRYTKVFALKCNFCNRYFKHCMFSKAERRIDNDNRTCRWCQADNDENYDRNQWEVHHHIHCNKTGKKVCRPWCSLNPPPGVKDNYHWVGKKPIAVSGEQKKDSRIVAWQTGSIRGRER